MQNKIRHKKLKPIAEDVETLLSEPLATTIAEPVIELSDPVPEENK